MTGTARATPAEPDGAPRSAVLDILRGLAILAILFMNISDMGGSLYAFFAGDPRRLGWSGADQIAWWAREVLANGTARALLEMLFGAGMVILTERAARHLGKWQVLRAYALRNLVLILFGVVHVLVLLWPGDILHSYGIAALVAMWFRNFRPRWLLTFGLSLAVLQLVGVSIGVGVEAAGRPELQRIEAKDQAGQPLTKAERKTLVDERKDRAAGDKRRAEILAKADAEDRARTGTALSWVQSLWGIALWVQQSFLEIVIVLEAATTMLIGAALFKLGILQGNRSARFYLRLTLTAYAVGLSLRAWGAYEATRFLPGLDLSIAFSELARLATTLGHVGLVNLLVLGVAGQRLMRPFEAAGRTALTLYILQSLICLWVLYPPWGLRLYNQQNWVGLMLTALAVNAALLVLANWWVKRFAIAPVEWAWRSIVEGRRLPFRRVEATA